VNIHELIGEPIPEFLRGRVLAFFDAVTYPLLTGALVWVASRFSRAKFLVHYSLRARLLIMVAGLAILSGTGWALNVSPTVLLCVSFIAFALLVCRVMRDLTAVGITNAFETTKDGVSAADTLKQVKRDLVFLGIGAKKLTDAPEFDAMVERCQKGGGRLRFLLSDPENAALKEMARRNGRNDLSYQSRVRDSIREIFTRAGSKVNLEVRLYHFDREIALPHFRLMFIDDRLCVFSQLVWTAGEGLDNPQLVLRRDEKSAGSSLYQGYRDYFEALWNLDTTVQVTPKLIEGWPA
jgi:hypothetical protein